MNFEDMINQIRTAGFEAEDEPKGKVKEVQWRCQILQGDVLIVDHAQNDFDKVFRFTMNALAELHNNKVTNFRVHIQDREGNLYFFVIGENTPVTQYKKATKYDN